MKNLSIIACISEDRGLGYKGDLIWHISEDLKFFKQTTMGNIIVMGRKTFDSIGKPLPGRENVVLSSRELTVPGIKWCKSSDELNDFLRHQAKPVFIIGGASLYEMYLDQAKVIYLTEVQCSKPADTYFPEFDQSKFTREVLKSGQQDGTKYEIVKYIRK